MLKELRKLRAKGGHDRAKANYISTLVSRGRLKGYLSPAGYMAYDTEEYSAYRKKAKRGRPPKFIKGE